MNSREAESFSGLRMSANAENINKDKYNAYISLYSSTSIAFRYLRDQRLVLILLS